MKITTGQLRKIIREEAARLAEADLAQMQQDTAAEKKAKALLEKLGVSSIESKLLSVAKGGKDSIREFFVGMIDLMHELNPVLSKPTVLQALMGAATEEKKSTPPEN